MAVGQFYHPFDTRVDPEEARRQVLNYFKEDLPFDDPPIELREENSHLFDFKVVHGTETVYRAEGIELYFIRAQVANPLKPSFRRHRGLGRSINTIIVASDDPSRGEDIVDELERTAYRNWLREPIADEYLAEARIPLKMLGSLKEKEDYALIALTLEAARGRHARMATFKEAAMEAKINATIRKEIGPFVDAYATLPDTAKRVFTAIKEKLEKLRQ